MQRSAIFATVAVAGVLGGAGVASADYLPGDKAIDHGYGFSLNPWTLEPGCFTADSKLAWHDSDIDSHVDVTEKRNQLHVSVDRDANFSVDQVLVPGPKGGYAVHNAFDTGTIDDDPDIDPDQTATDMEGPGGKLSWKKGDVILCVSDHPDSDSNEPYEQAPDGEVAAINRPIIAPKVSALGVSAVEPLNTYKVGFGYDVEQWYDNTWRKAFNHDKSPGYWYGDPQAFDLDHDGEFDHVFIKSRPEGPGVRRFNDIDEFGEEFNSGEEKSSYGQPVLFSGAGDDYAYLHKSLPGTIDGGGLWDVWEEMLADQTSFLGLMTFTTQGDLPIRWHLKASLAPERYARSTELTDDELRAWEASWQAYYEGTGPKPELPLAPGTNSPAPKPGVVVNPPEVNVVVDVPSAPAAPQPVQQPITPATDGGTVEVLGATAVAAAKSDRVVRLKLRRSIKSAARVRYVSASGPRMVRATKSGGRLVASVDLRGLGPKGSVAAVACAGKDARGRTVKYTVLVRL
jgi:hypothetical protein